MTLNRQLFCSWALSCALVISLSACATPQRTVAPPPPEKKLLYKDLMNDLANEMSQKLPPNSRIAVLNFPSSTGQETRFSANLATKLEMGFIDAGKEIVDRAKIEQVMKEQHLQQSDAALFDAAKSARLGKFIGANVVIGGQYVVLLPKKIIVTARAVSAETTRVISIREKEIPLEDAGADNWDSIVELLRTDNP